MNEKTQIVIQENEKFLSELLNDMRDPPLSDFMHFVFSPQGLLDEFLESPASRANHHAFPGGLAFHSIQSARLGKEIAKHYNDIGIKVNEDIVVAGILIHDIGKIHCYSDDEKLCNNASKQKCTYCGGAGQTDEGVLAPCCDCGGKGEKRTCGCKEKQKYHHVPRSSLFHHIPMGYLDIAKLADKFNLTRTSPHHQLSQKKIDKLLHIILSHHGRKSWSSPVIPQFTEAYIVHAVEMMDGYVEKYSSGVAVKDIYGQ